MKISDSLGKLMWNDFENVYADQSTFDVSFLPSGMYILSWKQKKKNIPCRSLRFSRGFT
ncbi:MAG: T9SS type A sorting domain-containing protein [Saprospiraceae bacterium]|nr:T9SS type A sorting domain-containing protein [Saprospiraceae bacterium]